MPQSATTIAVSTQQLHSRWLLRAAVAGFSLLHFILLVITLQMQTIIFSFCHGIYTLTPQVWAKLPFLHAASTLLPTTNKTLCIHRLF